MKHALANVSVAALLCGGVLWLGADADASVVRYTAVFGHGHGSGDGNGSSSGNGKFNHNSFIINSVSNSRDVLHFRNTNIGGINIMPGAVCLRSGHRCKIVQKIVVFDP
jgi:hypothetical protein